MITYLHPFTLCSVCILPQSRNNETAQAPAHTTVMLVIETIASCYQQRVPARWFSTITLHYIT